MIEGFAAGTDDTVEGDGHVGILAIVGMINLVCHRQQEDFIDRSGVCNRGAKYEGWSRITNGQ